MTVKELAEMVSFYARDYHTYKYLQVNFHQIIGITDVTETHVFQKIQLHIFMNMGAMGTSR